MMVNLALLANQAPFMQGVRTSLLIAAAVALVMAAITLFLRAEPATEREYMDGRMNID